MLPSVVELVCAYGIAFGLMNKVEFLRRVKFFDAMLSCSYCTGFHAGWMTWGITRLFHGVEPTVQSIAPVVVWAFASAAFCYTVDVVSQLAEGWIPRDK
jgi:hypothetical protein